MKSVLSLLLLTLVLTGCSYHQDMNEIYNDNTEKAEEILYNHSERLEELDEYR